MNITKYITPDRNDFVLVVIDMMRPVLRNERAHTSQTHKHIYIKRIKNASFTRERCIESLSSTARHEAEKGWARGGGFLLPICCNKIHAKTIGIIWWMSSVRCCVCVCVFVKCEN